MDRAEELRDLRGRESRESFAKKIKIHPQTLYLYESGKRVPSEENWNEMLSRLKANKEAHLVVQHHNQGNIFGSALGGVSIEGKNKENEDVATCQRCIELENVVNEKNEEISKLQAELLEMQKKYMKLLEKMAGV